MVAGYHINGKLGEGSVGTVFSAIRISDKKKVALKIIDPTYISKESGAKRFYRAVNICKDITHPNVIRIYDAGDSEGVYFIAMEYIGGKEVGAIINQYGHVSVPTTLQIGIQITAALQYAYERSFVHRDIKPRNIMVNRRGIAKLVDFGLAKRLYRPMQSVITAPGEAVGTLAYMPPEQIDNAIKADHRSDIYSLGATMYHMLTGKHPFSEGTFAEFVSAIMERVPERVDSLSRSIPSDLADIIERAMHKDPDSRYQTPAHFCNDLRTLAVRFNCLGRSASSSSKTMRLQKKATATS
jgi:serine/threonine-protein kinase